VKASRDILLGATALGGGYILARMVAKRMARRMDLTRPLAVTATDPHAKPEELHAASEEASRAGMPQTAQALADRARASQTGSTRPTPSAPVQVPARTPASPTSRQPSACEAWSAQAQRTAIKPDGTPVTDAEMARLLAAPRFLVPGDIERAVDTWAHRLGPPPAGCRTIWAQRWRGWIEG
jgi:hypothetical protein